MSSIVVISGRQQGEFLPLGRRTNVIGRAESLPLQVLDYTVSRKHLRIEFDRTDGAYYAQDLKSTNGVYINGIRILFPVVLQEGDVIQIGRTELVYTETREKNAINALQNFKKTGERKRITLEV